MPISLEDAEPERAFAATQLVEHLCNGNGNIATGISDDNPLWLRLSPLTRSSAPVAAPPLAAPA